jgi:hypothetical protein
MFFNTLLIVLAAPVYGDNILVVFPVLDRTHGLLGDSIVNTLLSIGHEVRKNEEKPFNNN